MEGGGFAGNKNDIALLRLEKPIKFSSVVSPACLHLERNEEYDDVKLVVSGWGATETREFITFLGFNMQIII